MIWDSQPLGPALRYRKEFVTITDLAEYRRCRVQVAGRGVVLRDIVPGSDIRTKQQQVCRAGDFLVAEIDAKMGGFGLVPPELDGAVVSSHYFLFEPNEIAILPKYLDYLCRSPLLVDQVNARGSTNYAAVRPHHVLGWKVPLPPLAEQERVVAVLDVLLSKIAGAERLRAEAREARDALVRAHLGPLFGDLAARFPTRFLEACCEDVVDCLHTTPAYTDEGVPTVRSPDVGFGSLSLTNAFRTSEADYQERIRRGAPRIGDIVYVREGGGAGRAGVVATDERFSLGQRTMMFRPSAAMLPDFFCLQLLSPQVYDDFVWGSMKKGSASPHVNIKELRRLRWVVPPLEAQASVVQSHGRLRAAVDEAQKLSAAAMTAAEELTSGLLNAAFSGRL